MSRHHDAVQQVQGGVDKNDQLRKYYHVALKCWKFYHYVFWFLLEVSVINAYISYTHFAKFGIEHS